MATTKKISELTALTTAANADLLYIVHDPAGVPTSNKITVGDLLKSVNAQAIDAKAANAYTNSVAVATALATNAYSNAVARATDLATNAYSGAVAYFANQTSMLTPNIAYTGVYNRYPAHLVLSKGNSIKLNTANSTVASTPNLYWLSETFEPVDQYGIQDVETLEFVNIGGLEGNCFIQSTGQLAVVDFHDVVAIINELAFTGLPSLTNVNANSVVYAGGVTCNALTSTSAQLNFPNLKVAGDIIYQLNNTHENTPLFPSLEKVKYSINFYNNTAAIDPTLSYDSLTEVGYIDMSLNSGMTACPAFPSLTKINFNVSIYDNVNMLTPPSFPLLETITGDFAIYTNGITTAPATPALVSIGGNINLSENASMVNGLDFSSLKSVAGDVYFNDCALDETSVNYILTTLASLDGTNGTTSYDSNVIDISGGTNAVPTGAGLAAITTLEARGCTVNRNT